ncbi:MAG: hypothetical protein V1794_14150, partial [Candidatus Glassbacteria bacterium]
TFIANLRRRGNSSWVVLAMNVPARLRSLITHVSEHLLPVCPVYRPLCPPVVLEFLDGNRAHNLVHSYNKLENYYK